MCFHWQKQGICHVDIFRGLVDCIEKHRAGPLAVRKFPQRPGTFSLVDSCGGHRFAARRRALCA
jgi:hypothetical protein